MYGDYAVTPGGQIAFIVLGFLALVWILVWVFLPFAVFGIKERLDTLIRLQREGNALIKNGSQGEPRRD